MTSKESSEFFTPVLYEPTLEALRVRPTGIYVDCTTGGGGHAAGVLAQLAAGGLLICLDKDEQALQAAAGRLAKVRTGGTFRLVKRDFAALKEVLSEQGIEQADGILADLGVSSHQLDIGERGFSYNQAGPLDMRMDRSAALTAEAVVNTWSQEKLAMILRTYGEERFSARIAEAIVQRRAVRRFTTTDDLSELICRVMPAKSKRERQHPAKRSFQAIRIAVNGELDSLKALLEAAPELLSDGGRLAISFHSLEDRLVKTPIAAGKPLVMSAGLPCFAACARWARSLWGAEVIAEAGEAAQMPGRARPGYGSSSGCATLDEGLSAVARRMVVRKWTETKDGIQGRAAVAGLQPGGRSEPGACGRLLHRRPCTNINSMSAPCNRASPTRWIHSTSGIGRFGGSMR